MDNILKVKNKKDYFFLALSLIIILGLPFIISMLIRGGINEYSNLIKPSFAPPAILFPIVWTILYILMAISFYRVLLLEKSGEDVTKELIIFIVQFVFNLIWPILFFYFNFRFLAFIELFILVILIFITIKFFYKKDKIAGILLIPYLLWCIFALILNYSVYFLNK